MEPRRFDALTRVVATGRRGLLRALGGAAVAGVAAAVARGAAVATCPPDEYRCPSGPCCPLYTYCCPTGCCLGPPQPCDGSCQHRVGGPHHGRCVPFPDGVPCEGGTCCGGTCTAGSC